MLGKVSGSSQVTHEKNCLQITGVDPDNTTAVNCQELRELHGLTIASLGESEFMHVEEDRQNFPEC